MQFKALLLDLDGTLIDTAPDMVGALNRVLTNHDLDTIDYSKARLLVSNGARALITYGFSHVHKQTLSESQMETLVSEFLNNYSDNVCIDSKPYNGMLETLELCKSNQARWGVITNKPLDLSRDLLAGLNLLDDCSILLGGDSLPVKKPDPAPLLHTCMVLNLAASECLYVGDHERDIQAGAAAGMDTAAALWGYISGDQNPEDWNPNYLLSKPSGLHQLVKDKLSK